MEDIGVNWHGLVAQLISFGLLLIILYAFAYKPIQKMMLERQTKIAEGLQKSEEAEHRAEDIDVEAKEALSEARKEGQVLIAQAKEAADKRREDDMAQARKDADALIERARAEILLEKDRAINELRKEFADIAIFAAEKVINEELDAEKHRKVIDEVLQASSFKE